MTPGERMPPSVSARFRPVRPPVEPGLGNGKQSWPPTMSTSGPLSDVRARNYARQWTQIHALDRYTCHHTALAPTHTHTLPSRTVLSYTPSAFRVDTIRPTCASTDVNPP